MQPLICFYQNRLIVSNRYQRIAKPIQQSALEFLKEIESKYFDELKIIQIDFDAFQKQDPKKINYYQSPGLQVFILTDFKDLDQDVTKSISEFLESHLPIENKSKNTILNEPIFEIQTSQSTFQTQVKKIIQDINHGRFYQVNLTAAFSAYFDNSHSSLQLFKNYFTKFRPQYPAYLSNEDFEILCFSPELFLKKENSTVITRPIKGTSVAGYDEILKNPKEASELSMIVDLLRNDLQTIGNSKAIVTAHRKKLELPYTTHTFSEIQITTDKTLPIILQKTMPGGSISGCPKIESLAAIAEHENFNRKFYTGTIGWWKQNDFELNIAIRSFVRTQNRIHYFAGCGIVSESDPDSEWNELLNKASKIKLTHH